METGMEIAMEPWKIFLIIGIALVVIAPIVGIVIGKQVAKQKNNPNPPILNKKEKIIFISSLVLGAALIVTGIFWPQPKQNAEVNGFDNPETMEPDKNTEIEPSGGTKDRQNTQMGGAVTIIG